MTSRPSRTKSPAQPRHHALRHHKVPALTLFYYGLPTVAYGYMFCLVGLYFMKFATDVLLISPVIMGLIFGLSRLWDAVSDPLVGYLSDRTTGGLGRRKNWIALSALPSGLAFWLLFAPMGGLSATALIVWIAFGVISFYTASTLFYVPQMALGAELSDDHHERNKIFGVRHGGWIGGYILGIAGMAILLQAEKEGLAAVRAFASEQAVAVGAIAIVTLLVCAFGIKERPEFSGKGSRHPYRAIKDVFKNQHARPPLLSFFCDNIGFSFGSIMALYMASYVMHAPLAAPKFLLAFLLPSFLLTPIWMPLARRFGKKTIWLFALYLSAIAFGGMFFVGRGDELLMICMAVCAGIGNGATHIVGPSVLSDTVDYDELQTGERKEGAYFAAWNFTWKTGYGLATIIVGILLSASGFVPNVAQSETALLMIKMMFAIFPCLSYMLAAFCLAKYELDENAHRAIHSELQQKRDYADETAY